MHGRVLVLVALACCTRPNPFFCNDPANKSDPLCAMADGSDGSGSGSSCDDSSTCTTAGLMVCDTTMHKCVECVMSTDCTGDPNKPVCDGDACRGCTADADCPASDFCDLDTGACAIADNVIYVASGGTNNATCAQASPCDQLSTAAGVAGTSGKRRIHVAKATFSDTQTASFTSDADVHGGGATIQNANNDAIDVSNANVTIRDLIVATPGKDGLACSGVSTTLRLLGVTATGHLTSAGLHGVSSTCDLEMDRCLIQNNKAGGIQITAGTYHITNTIVLGNGSTVSSIGGVSITGISTTGNSFAANTVAGNNQTAAVPGNPSGVDCRANMALQTLTNNIVSGNAGATTQIVEDAHCTSTFTDSDADLPSSNTNTKLSPGLDGTGHLQDNSPMIDKGDPNLGLDHDFDGDHRPKGSGFDIGADEH